MGKVPYKNCRYCGASLPRDFDTSSPWLGLGYCSRNHEFLGGINAFVVGNMLGVLVVVVAVILLMVIVII